jgi:hypothetical protein
MYAKNPAGDKLSQRVPFIKLVLHVRIENEVSLAAAFGIFFSPS